MDSLLVINAGSSSVKFQLFGMDGLKDVERLVNTGLARTRDCARLSQVSNRSMKVFLQSVSPLSRRPSKSQ
jgi:acetate kinase